MILDSYGTAERICNLGALVCCVALFASKRLQIHESCSQRIAFTCRLSSFLTPVSVDFLLGFASVAAL